jgi:hypothetical protein
MAHCRHSQKCSVEWLIRNPKTLPPSRRTKGFVHFGLAHLETMALLQSLQLCLCMYLTFGTIE